MILLVFLFILTPLHAQSPDAAITVVGQPTAERFRREDKFYARNVWDMAVFDGRLYIASGNSSNHDPAPNAGPVDVWSYDAATDTFTNEITLPEEQIDRFIVTEDEAGSALMIPGHDPKGDEHDAAFYVRESGGTDWLTRREFPETAHVYDLYRHNGTWFAALGAFDYTGGAAAAVYDDVGAQWTFMVLAPVPNRRETVGRVYELFPIGDQLYASVAPRPIGETPFTQTTSLYRYGSGVFTPVNDLDILGNGDVPPLGRVARPVVYQGRTVYIAADLYNDHHWQPRTLASVSGDLDVTLHDVVGVPYDLLVHGEALLALTWDADAEQVHVLATCDLETWREVVAFDAPTFARSFAVYDGDLYVGLGGEPVYDPIFNTLLDNPPPETGEIWRVDGDMLRLTC